MASSAAEQWGGVLLLGAPAEQASRVRVEMHLTSPDLKRGRWQEEGKTRIRRSVSRGNHLLFPLSLSTPQGESYKPGPSASCAAPKEPSRHFCRAPGPGWESGPPGLLVAAPPCLPARWWLCPDPRRSPGGLPCEPAVAPTSFPLAIGNLPAALLVF